MMLARSLSLLLFCWIAMPAARAELAVPLLTGRVVDLANLLSSGDEAELTERLARAEQSFGYQLVIVTLPDLQSYPIEKWGLQLGRSWGIGQKGENNGLLLLIAPNDRSVRIEVGYGLEGLIPDALAHAIIQKRIIPYFRQGDFAGGIKSGTDALIQSLGGEGAKVAKQTEEEGLSDFIPFIVFGLFLFMVMMVRRSNRRYSRWGRGAVISFGAGSFSGRNRGGGGGFSGGGGSFGGGGASGRW